MVVALRLEARIALPAVSLALSGGLAAVAPSLLAPLGRGEAVELIVANGYTVTFVVASDSASIRLLAVEAPGYSIGSTAWCTVRVLAALNGSIIADAILQPGESVRLDTPAWPVLVLARIEDCWEVVGAWLEVYP